MGHELRPLETIDVPFCLGRTGVPNFDSYPSRDAIDSYTAQGFACFDQHLLIEWLEYKGVGFPTLCNGMTIQTETFFNCSALALKVFLLF